MTTQDKKLDKLSRTAALTFVLARAFNLMNQSLERQAREQRMVHNHETRLALGRIEEGCKAIGFGLKHFEDCALDSGITESGHFADAVAMEAYLEDGAWLAYLAGATFNASKYDDMIRLKIESLCKVKTTGEPLIEWSELERMRPQL